MTASDPGHIMQVASGYGISKALMSAVSLGLCTRLAGSPMTLDEIMEEYGFLRRPAMDFLDLPVVTEIAARKIAAAGLDDRIDAVAGDFFADPLPRADVVTMGMILHDRNLERKKLLVKKAYDALPADGAFIVIETLIDDARRHNTFGLFMSLTMLMEFGDAFDFTGSEFLSWCREAGFNRFEIVPLEGPSSAAIAFK